MGTVFSDHNDNGFLSGDEHRSGPAFASNGLTCVAKRQRYITGLDSGQSDEAGGSVPAAGDDRYMYLVPAIKTPDAWNLLTSPRPAASAEGSTSRITSD